VNAVHSAVLILNNALLLRSFVTEISERFKIYTNKSTVEADDSELVKYFPKLIWVVRDFTLQLEIDGKPITDDEYLDNSLKLKTGFYISLSFYRNLVII